MKNIKLLLEYDGSNYYGWQKQKNNMSTIQGTLEDAIFNITSENIKVIGCSRTDSKVHSKGYVCNFETNSKIPVQNFKKVLNSKLPNDIVVLKSEEEDLNFHSRFDSKGKTYVYKILNSEDPIAIGRNYYYHFPQALNIDDMKKACMYIVGTHDFSAFKTQGSNAKTSIRTINSISIKKIEDIIEITISGDGFLYNMVRIIVGTLLQIGIGKRSFDSIKFIIESKDRNNAGPCAPGAGLCLKQVLY